MVENSRLVVIHHITNGLVVVRTTAVGGTLLALTPSDIINAVRKKKSARRAKVIVIMVS